MRTIIRNSLVMVLMVGTFQMPSINSTHAASSQKKTKDDKKKKWVLPVIVALGVAAAIFLPKLFRKNQSAETLAHSGGSSGGFVEAWGDNTYPQEHTTFSAFLESQALETARERRELSGTWAITNAKAKPIGKPANRYESDGTYSGEGWCLRYVKIALQRAGCVPGHSEADLLSQKQWSTTDWARDFGQDMVRLGWTNTCGNGCTQKDITKAPLGAVIIYGRTDENKFGHAEIKVRQGRISDHLVRANTYSPLPISGIYYPRNPKTACQSQRPQMLAKR